LLFDSKLGRLAAGFFQTTLGKQQSRLLCAIFEFLRHQFKHVAVEVVAVILVDTGTSQHFLQRFLVYFFKSIVQRTSFFGVLVKLVEVGVRVFVDVGVSEEVKKIAKLILYKFLLLLGVAFSARIKLASSLLKLIGLSC
jgi:hypothetical protein